MTQPDDTPHSRVVVPLVLVALVFVGHALAGFGLYAARVNVGGVVLKSEMVVFGLPFLAAMAGYFLALSSMHWFRMRRYMTGVSAFIAAFLSMWVSLFFAFNAYGT